MPSRIIGIGSPRSVQEMMSRSDRNAITVSKAVPPMKRGRHRRKGQVGANKMLALPSHPKACVGNASKEASSRP